MTEYAAVDLKSLRRNAVHGYVMYTFTVYKYMRLLGTSSLYISTWVCYVHSLSISTWVCYVHLHCL